MKTHADKVLAKHASAFLMEPDGSVEEEILKRLNFVLIANGFDALPDGFVEWGCVEHGVVHVLAFYGQQWIEIDPRTGEATLI